MSGSRDTSPDALEAQRKAFRRMTGSQRFAMAVRMSDETRALADAGARHREQVQAKPAPRPD